MRLKINKKRIYELIYISGIIFGTIIVNKLENSDHNGLKFIYASRNTASSYVAEKIIRRIVYTGIFFFLCMTPYKNIFAAATLLYFGISTGMIISIMTIWHGYAGLLCYLLSVPPYMIFYILSFIVIIRSHKSQTGHPHIRAVLFIILLSTVGILSEIFITPCLLKMAFPKS